MFYSSCHDHIIRTSREYNVSQDNGIGSDCDDSLYLQDLDDAFKIFGDKTEVATKRETFWEMESAMQSHSVSYLQYYSSLNHGTNLALLTDKGGSFRSFLPLDGILHELSPGI